MIWDNRFGADEEAAAAAAELKQDSKKQAQKNMKNEIKAAEKDQKSGDEPLGNVTLAATTFKVLSGANRIMPGCLVREVTIKREK